MSGRVPQRALPVGAVVHGRYRIQSVLGEGGFGVTYQVLDLSGGQLAAMKEYMPLDMAYRAPSGPEVCPYPEQARNYERFRDRFQEEAQILYRYREHPNIIHVYHLFCENNTAYYTMEFIRGMDLGKRLGACGGIISWQELQPTMAQVVQALALVHSSGIIHCDISPDNIFLKDGGQVKLIDFGAAKSVYKGPSSIVLLKQGFAPPEQLSSHSRLGPWTDIYALGVTVYRCITGTMPPNASDRLTGKAVVPPTRLGAAVPSPDFEEGLLRAMALRIEDRFGTVLEFWDALTAPSSRPVGLRGIRGICRGRYLPVPGETILGTDPRRCDYVYPGNTPGVSHVHLRAWPQDGALMVMDMGSSWGTWLDGERMCPGLGYVLRPGSMIWFGEDQVFALGDAP